MLHKLTRFQIAGPHIAILSPQVDFGLLNFGLRNVHESELFFLFCSVRFYSRFNRDSSFEIENFSNIPAAFSVKESEFALRPFLDHDETFPNEEGIHFVCAVLLSAAQWEVGFLTCSFSRHAFLCPDGGHNWAACTSHHFRALHAARLLPLSLVYRSTRAEWSRTTHARTRGSTGSSSFGGALSCTLGLIRICRPVMILVYDTAGCRSVVCWRHSRVSDFAGQSIEPDSSICLGKLSRSQGLKRAYVFPFSRPMSVQVTMKTCSSASAIVLCFSRALESCLESVWDCLFSELCGIMCEVSFAAESAVRLLLTAYTEGLFCCTLGCDVQGPSLHVPFFIFDVNSFFLKN